MWSGWQGINGNWPGLTYIHITITVVCHVREAQLWMEGEKEGWRVTILTYFLYYFVLFTVICFIIQQLKQPIIIGVLLQVQFFSYGLIWSDRESISMCSLLSSQQIPFCYPTIKTFFKCLYITPWPKWPHAQGVVTSFVSLKQLCFQVFSCSKVNTRTSVWRWRGEAWMAENLQEPPVAALANDNN